MNAAVALFTQSRAVLNPRQVQARAHTLDADLTAERQRAAELSAALAALTDRSASRQL